MFDLNFIRIYLGLKGNEKISEDVRNGSQSKQIVTSFFRWQIHGSQSETNNSENFFLTRSETLNITKFESSGMKSSTKV